MSCYTVIGIKLEEIYMQRLLVEAIGRKIKLRKILFAFISP